MANRVIRDWTDSENVDKLSANAEVFFTRLFMKADDFGSYYSNPKLLKSNLFPLRADNLSDVEISKWLKECCDASLIMLYEANNKYYLRINNFGQRLRNMRGKFPDPQQIAETCSKSLPETETKQNPKQETESETKKENLPQQIKSIELPFSSEAFALKWKEWIEYRTEIKKPFKSEKSVSAALKQLSKYSEKFSIMLIDRSISNQWQGLIFEKTDLEFKNYKHDATNKIVTPGNGFGKL